MTDTLPPDGYYFAISYSEKSEEQLASFQEYKITEPEVLEVPLIDDQLIHETLKGYKHGYLTLKRGVSDENAFVKWISGTVGGGFKDPIHEKDLQVSLMDLNGNIVASWKFDRVFPIDFGCSFLQNAKVAFEMIDFTFTTYTRIV